MSTPLVPLPAQPPGVPWPGRTWPRADLDARVDRRELEQLVDGSFHRPADLGTTRAVLVIQGGAIVLERYAEGLCARTSHRSWSMAKSWLHAVVGILVGQGRLDVDAPADVPEWSDPADPRRAITLGQLLQMRSGLDFVEDYLESPKGRRTVIEMLFGEGRDDVAGYAAGSPLAHESGSTFQYSSGTSNIVARLASRAAGRSGEAWHAWLRRELFEPIGAASAEPRFDAAGTWIASSFLHATAEDFARLGLLYLRDGVWGGRQILPGGWVDQAREERSRDDEGRGYGAHFWVETGSLGIFQCQGYDGQRTTMVPALDLIVVRLGQTTADLAPNLNLFMECLIDCFRPTAVPSIAPADGSGTIRGGGTRR